MNEQYRLISRLIISKPEGFTIETDIDRLELRTYQNSKRDTVLLLKTLDATRVTVHDLALIGEIVSGLAMIHSNDQKFEVIIKYLNRNSK